MLTRVLSDSALQAANLLSLKRSGHVPSSAPIDALLQQASSYGDLPREQREQFCDHIKQLLTSLQASTGIVPGTEATVRSTDVASYTLSRQVLVAWHHQSLVSYACTTLLQIGRSA